MIQSMNLVYEINESIPKGLNNIVPNDLANVTNNYVRNIDCVCLDNFELKDRNQVFVNMINKLCIGGTAAIKILNPSLMANKINKSEINGRKLSDLLVNIKSVWSLEEVDDILNQLNLNVKGLYYENLYSIYQLEKA